MPPQCAETRCRDVFCRSEKGFKQAIAEQCSLIGTIATGAEGQPFRWGVVVPLSVVARARPVQIARAESTLVARVVRTRGMHGRGMTVRSQAVD